MNWMKINTQEYKIEIFSFHFRCWNDRFPYGVVILVFCDLIVLEVWFVWKWGKRNQNEICVLFFTKKGIFSIAVREKEKCHGMNMNFIEWNVNIGICVRENDIEMWCMSLRLFVINNKKCLIWLLRLRFNVV